MEEYFPFQSPNVEDRSRLRIDTTEKTVAKKIQFLKLPEHVDDPDMAFGRRKHQVKAIFDGIVGSNFLSNGKVTRALNTGFQTEFLGDHDGQSRLPVYGPLAAVVKDTITHLMSQHPSALTHEQKVLLWILTQKDTKDKRHQRGHLAELCLFLAEMASQPQDPDELRQFTKEFVLFLLDNVVCNETSVKYERLLQALDLPVPPSRLEKKELFCNNAQLAIVALIVGDNSMDSVVTVYQAKMKAFSAATPKEYLEEKRILPKKAQTPRVADLWASDDFVEREANPDDEVIYFMTGEPPVRKEQVSRGKVDDATTIDTAPTEPTTRCITPEEQERVLAHFDRLQACAAKNGDMTLNDVQDMVDFFVDPLSKAAFVSHASSVFRPVSPLSRDISPLTVQSEPNKTTMIVGATITEEGVRHAFQRLYARRNDPDCSHLKFLEKDEAIPDSWRSDELQSDLDPVVTGQKWVIEDFEILRVIDGGNFGRLLDLRSKAHPSMRLCGKAEFFSTYDFVSSGKNELIEGSKLNHKNIARNLGYFFVPWLGDRQKPICMCILQEQGLYNLRKIIVELNDESNGLAPLEKLRTALSIIVQVLDSVANMQDVCLFHRDIKPENVRTHLLFDNTFTNYNQIVLFMDSFYKLVDFGLAREYRYEEDGTLTQLCGTGRYIPPEGKGTTHDCFSTGIVFYELMNGGFPSEEVPTEEELAQTFKIEGVDESTAQKALDLCEGLTCYSEKMRWTGKRAFGFAKDLLESLPEQSES